jgi:hypothetical protein
VSTVNKRRVTLAAAAVVALVAAFSVYAATAALLDGPDATVSDLTTGAVVQIGTFPATGSGEKRVMLLQQTNNGLVCLWDAPSADSPERLGGCNPITDALGNSTSLWASTQFDGGPRPEDVTDLRLMGIANADVAAVHLQMSNGASLAIPFAGREVIINGGRFKTFSYRLPDKDLATDDAPTAVIATDSSGDAIGTQKTGL